MKRILFLLLLLLLPALSFAEAPVRVRYDEGGAAGLRFEDVCLEEEAGQILLLPKETLTHVVLEELTWTEDRLVPSVLAVWDRLDAGCAIRIQGYLYDVLPRFRLSCTGKNGTSGRYYINDSGEDGSLFLTDGEELNPWCPCETVLPERALQLEAELDALPMTYAPESVRIAAARLLYYSWECAREELWNGYAMSADETAWYLMQEATAAPGTEQALREAAALARERVYYLLYLD